MRRITYNQHLVIVTKNALPNDRPKYDTRVLPNFSGQQHNFTEKLHINSIRYVGANMYL